MEYVVLILFWVAWCAVHSSMISLTFTGFVKKRLGARYHFYRLFFNLVAALTLIPPVWYTSQLRKQLLWQLEGFPNLVRWSLLVVVLVLSVAGAMKYDLGQFLGVRQIMSGRSPNALTKSGELDTSGILSVTRHPWYLAALIFVWTGNFEIYCSTLIVKVILTAYLIIGTILEERKLVVEYGDVYLHYQQRVSMLFPWKWVVCRWFGNQST